MNRLPLRIAVFLLGVAAAFPAPGDDAAAPSMKPAERKSPEAMTGTKPGDEAMTGRGKPGGELKTTPEEPAAAPPKRPSTGDTAALSPAAEARLDAMARRIDALLEAAWADRGIVPAAPAADERFLRRVSLDLIGRIPRVSEIREFLGDAAADRRRQVVERLLASREHADYMGALWQGAFAPDIDGNAGSLVAAWFARQFGDGVAYDRVARNVVLGNTKEGRDANGGLAIDRTPTELAAAVSRTFLGMQIQCAECHKHPTDVWTQDDFWGFAAFFGPVTHPATKATVQPRFLGDAPAVATSRPAREQLAEWLASPANPWFAKAMVNRLWGLLFGAGIVNPVDDLGSHNPPAHAGLLDELAGFFAAGGWNHRDVLRVLARTRAYGLSSGDGRADRLFAAMPLEPLNAVQLYNSLAVAYHAAKVSPNGMQAVGRAPATQFLAKFRTAPGQQREYTAGIPQAIALMNGQMFDPMRVVYHEAMIASRTDPERIETLFLATVSRPPVDAELATCLEVLGRETTAAGRRLALVDIHWALVNSAEFAFSP